MAGLCQRCAEGAIINDEGEGFYEGEDQFGLQIGYRNPDNGSDKADAAVHLRPGIRWQDTAPDFPRILESATTTWASGCRLCAYLHAALLRRAVDYQGPVVVVATYLWDYNRSRLYSNGRHGLSFMWCRVFSEANADGNSLLAQIIFSVEVEDEDVCLWLGADRRRQSEPLCSDNILWLTSELQTWDSTPAVQKKDRNTSPKRLPKRLIYVGQENDTDPPHLALTEDLAGVPKYAALSYCWGEKKDADRQLRATRAMLPAYFCGISQSDITPVLRDALVTCRALAIPYLWIDAVCIAQDDGDDWASESEAMAQIFYHAYLTICPLVSKSCMQGFLGRRPGGVELPFASKRHPGTTGTVTLFASCDDQMLQQAKDDRLYTLLERLGDPLNVDILLSAWTERGWTYQEGCCSRRILYFGDTMMHLARANLYVSENGYKDWGPHGHNSMISNLIERSLIEDGSFEQEGVRTSLEYRSQQAEAVICWNSISLSGRQFTKPQDILPAISGLAAMYNRFHQDVYLAGLWRRRLHFNLLWLNVKPPQGNLDETVRALQDMNSSPSSYIAPSWSWVQRVLLYSFDVFMPTHYRVPGLHAQTGALVRTEQLDKTHGRPAFTLVDYRVDLANGSSNGYGRINSASLTVRGRLLPLSCTGATTLRWRIGHRAPLGYFANGLGTVHLDWLVDNVPAVLDEADALRLRLLLVTTVCQGTSNDTCLFYSNPEEGIHKKGLANRLVYEGIVVSDDNIGDDREDFAPPSACLSCADAAHPANVFGLVLCPADGKPNTYYRVGVFMLFGHTGGASHFDEAEETIELI